MCQPGKSFLRRGHMSWDFKEHTRKSMSAQGGWVFSRWNSWCTNPQLKCLGWSRDRTKMPVWLKDSQIKRKSGMSSRRGGQRVSSHSLVGHGKIFRLHSKKMGSYGRKVLSRGATGSNLHFRKRSLWLLCAEWSIERQVHKQEVL